MTAGVMSEKAESCSTCTKANVAECAHARFLLYFLIASACRNSKSLCNLVDAEAAHVAGASGP